MANPVVRPWPIFIDGKKAGTVNKGTYKINPRREPMFGVDGLLTFGKGAVTVELNATEITPVSGSSLANINKKIINQEDFELAAPIGGKLHKFTAACTGNEFEMDTESGRAGGQATFMGGVPTIEG